MHDLLSEFIEKYIPLTSEEKGTISSLDVFRTIKKGTILLKEGELTGWLFRFKRMHTNVLHKRWRRKDNRFLYRNGRDNAQLCLN